MINRDKKRLCNRYTYFPLYDTDKNSFIRRYRLWMKYRDYCIKNERKYVDVHTFSKVISSTQKKAAHQIVTNPNGVQFFKFKLKVAMIKLRRGASFFWMIDREYLPVIKVESKYKQRGKFKINYWNFFLNYGMRLKVMNHLKQSGKMFDYQVLSRYQKTIDDDLFNDF